MSSPEEHFGAMRVDLREVDFTADLLAVIPGEYARRYRVLPVATRPGVVVLALDDPSDLPAIDALHQLLDRDLELCIADSKQLDAFIERLYGADNDR
jgi:type IV pilus assembly protein PilB